MSHHIAPTLLSIKSAFPPFALTQEEIYEGLFKHWYRDVPHAERLVTQTRVKRRFMVWDPRETLAERSPGTGERMEVFRRVGLELGAQSLGPVLEAVDRSRIGSFTMASCSGYTGATPDLYLAKQFKLRSSLRRTFVGHMGCYAAFNAIKVAMDGLAARPQELALVNCTETSSLHFRPVPTAEQAVIHMLFGDASASLVLGNAEPGVGPQILRSHTEQLYETSDLMTWNVMNDGFSMTLSPFVPFVIHEHIRSFVGKLIGPEKLGAGDIKHWAIHPGGPKIVEFVGQQLELSESQLRPSWQVLEEYGNCSSVTVLLILEEILKNERPRPGEYGVLLGFGPGLTMEGLLVRF